MENVKIEFSIESGKYKIYVDGKLVVNKRKSTRIDMTGINGTIFDRIPKELKKLKKEYIKLENKPIY